MQAFGYHQKEIERKMLVQAASEGLTQLLGSQSGLPNLDGKASSDSVETKLSKTPLCILYQTVLDAVLQADLFLQTIAHQPSDHKCAYYALSLKLVTDHLQNAKLMCDQLPAIIQSVGDDRTMTLQRLQKQMELAVANCQEAVLPLRSVHA